MTDFAFRDEDKAEVEAAKNLQQAPPPTVPPATPGESSASSASVPSPPLPPVPPNLHPTAPAPDAHWEINDAASSSTSTAPAPSTAPAASKAPAAPTPSVPLPQTGKAQSGKTPSAHAASGAKPGNHAPSPPLPGKAPHEDKHLSPALQAAAEAGLPTSGELARQHELSAREKVENKDIPIWRVWLDKLDPIAFWLARIAVPVGALAILYILWGIFGGKIGVPPSGAEAVALSTQYAKNILVAGTVLKFALIFLAISAFILAFDVRALGASVAAAGVLLWFGAVPLLAKFVGPTVPVAMLGGQLLQAGKFLAFLGIIKCTLDLGAWLQELPNRIQARADVGPGVKAEGNQGRNANMFSPCWQLPFCREVIRRQCPAYLARTRCWKFGRGCYCDEEMIGRIIRGESLESIKAPTRLSQTGKPPCGRCYIFLEHQTLKYKTISPLAIPITLLIMFFGWNTYATLFMTGTRSLDALWKALSFGGGGLGSVANSVSSGLDSASGVERSTGPDMSVYELSSQDVQQAALMMFGFLLGLFLLIYISKFIEWAIYKAKW